VKIGFGEAATLAKTPLMESLTDREETVLRLLTQGLGNKDIALKLGLSVNTIKTHLKNIFKKLGVKSRLEAMRVALSTDSQSKPKAKITRLGEHKV